MPLPEPRPGLVISYSYLWHSQHETGRSEGNKDRPCAIILARLLVDGETMVLVAPITHSPPATPDLAIEIPVETKRRLQLDEEASWIVTSEVNRFVWPGPDLRPIARDRPQRFDYGFLPPRLFKAVTHSISQWAQRRKLKTVTRT
jgi:hypothetical protein